MPMLPSDFSVNQKPRITLTSPSWLPLPFAGRGVQGSASKRSV